MSRTHVLMGKTITNLLIAEDKKALLFKTTDGDVMARCDADCCSSTWVESVEVPALGFPAQVIDVAALDGLPTEDDGEWGDVIAHYGVKITTDRGDLVIDYRNSSNGYYGGNLSWPDDTYFYGGVYGQNVSNEQWQPLTTETAQ